MCGIAGIMMRDGRPLLPGVLSKLETALTHRGPDGSGHFASHSVGLLNTRLAIVDVKGGNQPFQDPEGAVLVANGEIYNDPDIRKQLSHAPYQTGSDCESALQMYRHKGLDFADELRGMYSIALYDQKLSQLILTRDPFGIKQLYYVITPTFLAFASEPQALLKAGLSGCKIVEQKRSELLQLKFTTGQETIFANIFRLLPGETIVVADGQIVERRRRRAIAKNSPQLKLSYSEALTKLNGILEESVAVHLRSDVPYGLFLSGGIDSSVLAHLMSRVSSSPVVAFTAAFPESKGGDEAEAARHIAKTTGAKHHIIDVTEKHFWTSAPRLAKALDDPTTDAASLPTFMLAEAAKGHLKVVLSGEGADELFAGYSRYARTQSFWRFLRKKKARTRGILSSMIGTSHALDHWRDGLQKTEAQEISPLWSSMQTLQAMDSAEWLPNDLLVKFDRCLMAHSLEGRTPFLDPVVAAFAFFLPDNMKVKGRFGKRLLRDWLSNHMPQSGAWAKKLGFNPPIGQWIAHHKEKLEPLVLTQPGIAEMSIKEVVKDVFADPVKNSQAAWNLVFYALWHSYHVLGVVSDGAIDDVLANAARLG